MSLFFQHLIRGLCSTLLNKCWDRKELEQCHEPPPPHLHLPSSIQGHAVYKWKRIQILIFLIQGPKKPNSGKHRALARSLNKWHSKTQGLFQWDSPFWNGSLCIDFHHLLSRLYRRDFPGGPVAKALCSQCRGPRFNPWSGNQIRVLQLKSGTAE